MKNEENIWLNTCWTEVCIVKRYTTWARTSRKKTASTNLNNLYFQAFNSSLFPYLNWNILYSIYLFCIRWSLVIGIFSNVGIHSSDWFFKTFNYFWKHVPANCWFHCIHISRFFRFRETFKPVTRILMIEILYKFRTIEPLSNLTLH